MDFSAEFSKALSMWCQLICSLEMFSLGRMAIMAVRVIKFPKKGYKIRSIFAQSTLFSKMKANFWWLETVASCFCCKNRTTPCKIMMF